MNGRINIAILSAGRRVELVQAFVEQAAHLSPRSRVFALDMRPELSSACQVAHQNAACPPALAPDYPGFLEAFFERQSIGLVIPTIDTDLQVLAENRARWATMGTFVSIPEPAVVSMCRNKRLSEALFSKIDVRYPELYSAAHIRFPAFVRPVSGSSSVGAMRLNESSDLTPGLLTDPTMIVTEYIGPPFVEYSVDAYFDQNSKFIAALPRRRIETRAGEISKGITVKAGLYRRLAATLGRWQGMRGCITLQVFYEDSRDDVVGIEINPRFGGGFPLSYSAGANYPGWLIGEYLCATPPVFFDAWQDRLLMLRYDAKILVSDATI